IRRIRDALSGARSRASVTDASLRNASGRWSTTGLSSILSDETLNLPPSHTATTNSGAPAASPRTKGDALVVAEVVPPRRWGVLAGYAIAGVALGALVWLWVAAARPLVPGREVASAPEPAANVSAAATPDAGAPQTMHVEVFASASPSSSAAPKPAAPVAAPRASHTPVSRRPSARPNPLPYR